MRLAEILRKKTTLVGGGDIYDYYFDESPIIYHGTSAKRAHAMGGMIEPRIGDFFRHAYPRAKVQPLVFAADQHFLSKIWSACRYAVAQELGLEDRRQMIVQQFIDHAAVLKIEADRAKFRQATTHDKPQRGVEKFDFYASEPVKIDAIIEGKALHDFFGKSYLMSHMIYEENEL